MRKMAFFSILAMSALAWSEPQVNDCFSFRSWYQLEDTAYYYPASVAAKIVAIASNDSVITYSTEAKVEDCPWWSQQAAANQPLDLTVLKKKPASVISCSAPYDSCRWLGSIKSRLAGKDYALSFPFPILPTGKKYADGSSYLIKISDTLGFYCFYSAGDSVFNCFLASMTKGGGPLGIRYPGTGAMWPLSNNPFRFGSLVFKGSDLSETNKIFHLDLQVLHDQGAGDARFYGLIFDKQYVEQATRSRYLRDPRLASPELRQDVQLNRFDLLGRRGKLFSKLSGFAVYSDRWGATGRILVK